jgi:hypothetical protein
MWAVDDGRERNDAEREKLRRQREAERERRFREEAKRFAQSLDALERDRNIRKIHAQVGLTARHRQNLLDRGLTDARIDEGKFFSIAPWQEVTGINPHLAGVDKDGRKLLIGQSGFACPIWNVQGQIIGWQTRFDDDTSGGKYKWPTSRNFKRPNGATAHLPNGELPITCCRPVGGVKCNSIGLAEGFLKPYIAAQRQGQVLIGAAGANFAGSPQQLKAYLDALSAELDTKTVVLYPDAASIANNAVMGHYERVIQMISEWGYSVSVAWWGQEDKSHPDIDSLPDDQEISYLTPEEFLELGGRSNRMAHSFADLLGWLPRFKRHLEKSRSSRWGFGRKGEVEVELPPPQQETPKYDQGERLDVWSSGNHMGYKHALDTSDTGLGKSFDAGRLTPEMFPDARQIIYVSTEHRNPTTPTLKNWPDLEARHDGLYRDEFGKLRRVDKDQPKVVPPNCGRNKTLGALRSKNIPGADTADLVCRTCPQFEPCRAGAAYDYLHSRAKALAEPRLRAHPDSLPAPDEYDYSQVVLVLEEAGEILKAHRSIEVRADDIRRTLADLCLKAPDAFDALRTLLNTLHLHTSGEIKQPNKYGWDDPQVRQMLPDLGSLDLDAIGLALRADPERILNTTKEHGVDSADLPRSVRKEFTERDSTTAERISRDLALNWLPDFLDVLLGNQNGSLRIQNGVLTITVGNDRLKRITEATSFNIYLDATATPEDIARAVGIEDFYQLLVVQQDVQPLDNLEVIQVAMGQRLGIGSRRQDKDGNDTFLQKRIDGAINQIRLNHSGSKLAVCDFKRHTKKGDGKRHHWVDTRGSNDLEDCDVLVLVGTMCRGLNALKDEFAVLYGRPPRAGTERVKYAIQVNGISSPDEQHWFEMDDSADPEFRAFVRRRILADIRQAIGRLRAHRRRDKQLKVYILGDYPLDFPVTLIQARDLTPDAATKKEKAEMAILLAAKHVLAQGQKLTQQAVSAATKLLDPQGKGYSQQHVSRCWALLILLLDSPNSKMSKTSQPPPDPEETEWMSNEYLPLLASSPEGELLDGVMLVFEAYGIGVFKAIWDAAPATAQIKILEVLMLTLPQRELQVLAAALGLQRNAT